MAVELAEHRERLIEGMARAIAAQGYRETTVADVVREARTSRRSFYEHFRDREACFLALFADTNRRTMERVAAAVDPRETLERQVEAAIDAYLDDVSRHPALYASFVHELPALGREGARQAQLALERFAELLVELVEAGRAVQPRLAPRPLALEVAIIIVGGLRQLVVIALQRGRDVRELREPAVAAVRGILAGALA